MNLNTLLTQADSLRFKLLGIVGSNEAKKKKIIKFLSDDDWTVVDVEKELLPVQMELNSCGGKSKSVAITK